MAFDPQIHMVDEDALWHFMRNCCCFSFLQHHHLFAEKNWATETAHSALAIQRIEGP